MSTPDPRADSDDDSSESSDSMSRFLDALGHDRARELAAELDRLEHLPEDEVPLPAPGDRIGRYRITGSIAHGGMGIVFEAEQTEPVRRSVALKLIRRGGATPRAIERFRIEQQTLAGLEHENIARLYDAGFDAHHRPYFVMELVRGAPITVYADHRRLSLRARLDLFLAVCRAVRFAHQKGVLHRDLKPANILVAERAGEPVPCVIDFGLSLAKASGASNAPHFESDFVGTPEYTSPERWFEPEESVDTRTDVYALGVVLYELVCGHLPWTDGHLSRPLPDQLAIRRTTRAPIPSERLLASKARETVARCRGLPAIRLARALRGDLDAIVSRAIAGDRCGRYADVSELIADLERHRDHWPIAAAPSGWGVRLAKFARRNRAATIGGALVVSTLVAGMTASVFQWRRAEDSLALALERESQTQRVRGFLERILSSPSDHEYSDPDPSLVAIVEKEEANLATAFAGLPFGEAQLRLVFARIFLRGGRPDRALEQFELALARHAEATPGLYGDELERARRLAIDCEEGRSLALLELGRCDEVIELVEPRLAAAPALAAHERARLLRLLGRAHEGARRRARGIEILDSAASAPESNGPEWTLIAEELCRMCLRDGQNERARAVARDLLARRVDRSPRRESAIGALSGLAALRCGDLEEAASLLEPAAIAGSRVFPDHHPRMRELLEALHELYSRRGGTGDADRAAAIDRRLAAAGSAQR